MRNVAVHYDQLFEAKITSGLKNHVNRRLKIEGIGLFNGSKELESLRDIENVEEVFDDTIQQNESSSGTASIWELVEGMTKDIPKEEWDRLPRDLAENHDNCIN